MTKRCNILSLLFLVVCYQGNVHADSSVDGKAPVPVIIKQALDIYKGDGAEKFLLALSKGSPIDGDRSVIAQIDGVEKIENKYGRYLGYDIVQVHDISKRSRLTYYVMNYEKGPLFAKATSYKTENKGEVLASFYFHTSEEKIFPESLLVHNVEK